MHRIWCQFSNEMLVNAPNERVSSRDRRLSSANLERRIRLALLTKQNQIRKPTRKTNENELKDGNDELYVKLY